jgi:hypothetical protein
MSTNDGERGWSGTRCGLFFAFSFSFSFSLNLLFGQHKAPTPSQMAVKRPRSGQTSANGSGAADHAATTTATTTWAAATTETAAAAAPSQMATDKLSETNKDERDCNHGLLGGWCVLNFLFWLFRFFLFSSHPPPERVNSYSSDGCNSGCKRRRPCRHHRQRRSTTTTTAMLAPTPAAIDDDNNGHGTNASSDQRQRPCRHHRQQRLAATTMTMAVGGASTRNDDNRSDRAPIFFLFPFFPSHPKFWDGIATTTTTFLRGSPQHHGDDSIGDSASPP